MLFKKKQTLVFTGIRFIIPFLLSELCEDALNKVCVLSRSCRYLDNVVNNQTISPPIPHLHALLTSGNNPPPEIDVFELIKASYEVRGRSKSDVDEHQCQYDPY